MTAAFSANENYHQTNYSADQVTALRDLAHNGTTAEGSTFGYGDAQSSNGAPSNDYLSSEAYVALGLANSSTALESVALLESLANFEHLPNDNSTPVSNDHFASLLQAAAATASGQEIQNNGAQVQEYALSNSSLRGTSSLEQSDVEESNRIEIVAAHVRKSKQKARADALEDARVLEIWGPEAGEDTENVSEHRNGTPLRLDGRTVGLHSISALFRRPSEASKRYTRPPMSKMFASLELSPEQFVRLQSGAKDYMLDPKHPERAQCVAVKGQPDTDMVRLRLFGCVKSFLEDDGWGEKCFGAGSENFANRKLIWPQMKNKIISLSMPLLRRIITNERQRKYAVETRKIKTQGKTGMGQCDTEMRDVETNQNHDIQSSSHVPGIDPKLNSYQCDIDASFSVHLPSNEAPASASNDYYSMEAAELNYHINILRNGHRMKPKAILTPANCQNFQSLMAYIHGFVHGSVGEGQTPSTIKVLTSDGLVLVEDDDAWSKVVASVKGSSWMDGEVRCVVELEA